MASTFQYSYVQTATAVLEIENLGQCAIEGSNSFGEYYYLVIRTSLGKCYIFNYGPIMLDLDMLPPFVGCSIERIDYNEKQLTKRIVRWLEDPKKKISNAREVSDQEAFDSCRDLIAYMREYRQEVE